MVRKTDNLTGRFGQVNLSMSGVNYLTLNYFKDYKNNQRRVYVNPSTIC